MAVLVKLRDLVTAPPSFFLKVEKLYMDLFNWVSLGIAPISSVITWFAARRVRNNSTLQSLQNTIDMLIDKNTELYNKIVEQAAEMAEMKVELIALRKQIKPTAKKPKKQ